MSPETLESIRLEIKKLETPPTRRALSSRFPFFKKPIILVRQLLRTLQNKTRPIAQKYSTEFFSAHVARHESLLMRKLGEADMRLQQNKITNLKIAVEKINGLVIKPGEIFSYWETIGRPSSGRGFVDGMLLASGRIVEGVGGGLCQLSNLLYWLFLHADITVVERHHHAMDVFPDSGRVLPFGSGATVLYNFVDLQVKNTSDQPLQIKLWLTDAQLKGEILAPQSVAKKFSIKEKNHCFIKRPGGYVRYNELYREELIEGKIIKTEKILTNCAPVLYPVDERYIVERGYMEIEI